MLLPEEFIHSVPELFSFVRYTADNNILMKFMANKKLILKKPSG